MTEEKMKACNASVKQVLESYGWTKKEKVSLLMGQGLQMIINSIKIMYPQDNLEETFFQTVEEMCRIALRVEKNKNN